MACWYKHTGICATVSAAVGVVAGLVSLPSLLLYGLHTYIHPETLGHGAVAAIRRPSDSSPVPADPKKRARSKTSSSSEFDDANAQLFRLRLVDSHLRTRLYFPEYRVSFIASFSALSSVLISHLLPGESRIPLISSLCASLCVLASLAKIPFERSATKRSEKQLTALFGLVGFLFASSVLFSASPSVLGFDFRCSADDADDAAAAAAAAAAALVKALAAVVAGCLAGLLFVPATRAARSMWIGTDQLRWNFRVVSCGLLARGLLYLSFLANVLAVSLWFKPVATVAETALPNGRFAGFRVGCLVLASALQLLALRPNLQMYLNEPVLSWYHSLHASKLPDMDFQRAKIFLHNYYLSLVLLQFFAPPVLALLFLALSPMGRGNLQFSPSLFNHIPLFLAWWILFLWTIFMTCTLALLRRAFLFI